MIRDKRGKSGGIYFERKIYQSKAFCSLSRNGMKFLIAILDQRRMNPAYKNAVKKGFRAERFIDLDKIEMPYRTVHRKYGIPMSKVPQAIDDCMAKGFINITHHGGNGEHDKSTYALTDDFMTWKTGQVIHKRQNDAKRGYRGKRLGAIAQKSHDGGARFKWRLPPENKSNTRTKGDTYTHDER